MGFSELFNTIDPNQARNAVMVIDAGGRSDRNMSIWLVVWSPYTAYGFFPQNSLAGMLSVSDGKRGWGFGVCVPDWRYVVRIANIEIPENEQISIQLFDLMDRAFALVPNIGSDACPAFYMNRTASFWCDVQDMRSQRSQDPLSIITQTKEGVPVDTFRDVPIRIIDVLRNDESPVL